MKKFKSTIVGLFLVVIGGAAGYLVSPAVQAESAAKLQWKLGAFLSSPFSDGYAAARLVDPESGVVCYVFTEKGFASCVKP